MVRSGSPAVTYVSTDGSEQSEEAADHTIQTASQFRSDDVASKVARHAATPVMLVRADE